MTNPLLSHVKLPGRVLQLPSKGVFYAPGVLAESVKNGEVHVQPMSALTELKLRSPDLLYSTKIIREVCEECIPEIRQPEALVSRDVDALFVFLVAATYGNDKKIKAIHECEGAKWHDYTVSLEAIMAAPNNECLNSKELLYQVALPSDHVVLLKPVTFTDSIELVATRQAIARREAMGESVPHEDKEAAVLQDMLAVIAGVQIKHGTETITVTNRHHIQEWLKKLSRKNMDMIAEASIKSSEWGFNFNIPIKCKDCGEMFDYDLDLNPVSFFSE